MLDIFIENLADKRVDIESLKSKFPQNYLWERMLYILISNFLDDLDAILNSFLVKNHKECIARTALEKANKIEAICKLRSVKSKNKIAKGELILFLIKIIKFAEAMGNFDLAENKKQELKLIKKNMRFSVDDGYKKIEKFLLKNKYLKEDKITDERLLYMYHFTSGVIHSNFGQFLHNKNPISHEDNNAILITLSAADIVIFNLRKIV